MRVLKGVAIGILTFILFWSLSALGVAVMAKTTLLNPDFAVAEFDKADLYPVVKDEIIRMVPADPQLNQYLSPALQKTLDQLEPWMKEQAHNVLYAAYDYLQGRTSSFSISISLDRFKTTLKDNLWQEFQKAPPPEARLLTPDQQRQFFDANYDQAASGLPSSLDIDDSIIPADSMAAIQTARQYLSRFNLILIGLILLNALLILGIVLLYRSVRAGTRSLGITFVTYGALELIAALVGIYLFSTNIAGLFGQSIPASVQSFLPQLVRDMLMPLIIFTGAFLVAGIALIVVSHVYKPRPAE